MSKGKMMILVMACMMLVIPITLGIRACSLASRMANNAVETAYQEFKPEELLRKYEWFKNASASLDAKIADIQVMEFRIKNMEKTYDSEKRKNWPRADLEQYNLWSNETAGVKLSYNSLSAEYNAQMAKLNWRFTNAGDLPKGATEVLPKEYKPYKTN